MAFSLSVVQHSLDLEEALVEGGFGLFAVDGGESSGRSALVCAADGTKSLIATVLSGRAVWYAFPSFGARRAA